MMFKLLLSLLLLLPVTAGEAQTRFDNILYGVAYYHECMPSDRLDEDIRLMKDAGISVVVWVNRHGAFLNPGKANLNLPGWTGLLIKCMLPG